MIGDVFLVIFAIIGGLVALVLVMPLSARAEAELDGDEGAGWRARIAWAFGVVSLHLDKHGTIVRVFGLRVARTRWVGETPAEREAKRTRAVKKAAKHEAKKDTKEDSGRGLFWFLASRRGLVAIVRRYLRALHLSGRVEGVIGLAQPDQTALLHQVLLLVERNVPTGLVAIDVDWVDELVELEGHVSGWVWLLEIVGITLWFFLHPKWRRVWRAPRAQTADHEAIKGGVS